jgi:endonuclease VIII
MTGWWGVYPRGRRWSRSPRRAWLVIRTLEHEVVEFDGPVLELMTESRSRFDRRLAALGPDVLAGELDERAVLARLRQDDQRRGVGDALLDQRNLAGVGNVWKSEGCFRAGVDPWRPLGRVADDEALAVVREIRECMQASVEHGGHPRDLQVYNRRGRPCPRCGGRIQARGQGDDNRTTYWCPACQA